MSEFDTRPPAFLAVLPFSWTYAASALRTSCGKTSFRYIASSCLGEEGAMVERACCGVISGERILVSAVTMRRRGFRQSAICGHHPTPLRFGEMEEWPCEPLTGERPKTARIRISCDVVSQESTRGQLRHSPEACHSNIRICRRPPGSAGA